ncbi:unnamed protein product [Arabidopsis halleri]
MVRKSVELSKLFITYQICYNSLFQIPIQSQVDV